MPHLSSFKVVIYFLFLAVVDHSVLPAFSIAGVYPSFLYLFVCYAAFEWEAKKTVPVAFWAGLLKDFMSGGVLGVQAGVMAAVAILLDQAVRRIEREFPGIYFLITFLYVLICELIKLLLAFFVGSVQTLIPFYFGGIFLMSFYTALLLPVFDLLTRYWFGARSLGKQYELFK